MMAVPFPSPRNIYVNSIAVQESTQGSRCSPGFMKVAGPGSGYTTIPPTVD
jgi:hypothetical protein